MDPFHKILMGDYFDAMPVRAWNTFIDSAQDFLRRQNGLRAPVQYGSWSSGIFPVRNDSGADRARFEILTITGTLFTQASRPEEFYNQPTMTAGATSTPPEKFVILQEPVKSGEVGRGMLIGVSAVQIDMVDATDDWADVISGDSSKLRSGPFGSSRIVYVPSGTGTKWGYVETGIYSPFAIGKTASSHVKGASGTINIYRGSSKGSETWAGSKTLTAWNRFGDVVSGKWVLCAWIQRGWEIIQAEC